MFINNNSNLNLKNVKSGKKKIKKLSWNGKRLKWNKYSYRMIYSKIMWGKWLIYNSITQWFFIFTL